jgi:hypothetical protein
MRWGSGMEGKVVLEPCWRSEMSLVRGKGERTVSRLVALPRSLIAEADPGQITKSTAARTPAASQIRDTARA